MNYNLNKRQEEKFELYYAKYQEKIKLVLYKCNVGINNYNHFYSHALEGFLQAFLIMEKGDISQKDFPAFAYTNMKRKVIDEIRRFSRNKDVAVDINESYANFAYKDNELDEYIFKAAITKNLNNKENEIFKYLEEGYTYKEIMELENISKSTYYNMITSIKSKCENLLYK